MILIIFGIGSGLVSGLNCEAMTSYRTADEVGRATKLCTKNNPSRCNGLAYPEGESGMTLIEDLLVISVQRVRRTWLLGETVSIKIH